MSDSQTTEIQTAGETEITRDVKKRRIFSFDNFAKIMVKRQFQKNADTFIIIYGLPRTGKTVLGFNILIPYLRLMRMLYRRNLSEWKVPHTWKQLFNAHFAGDAEDMLKKHQFNPDRSFEFMDEGIDVMSWHDQMQKEQQDLIDLLQKTGKKKHMIILIIPSLSLLTKPILARAHYMFLIATEPSPEGNHAYLLKNYTNPILAENIPFGLKKIVDDMLKHPGLAERNVFENYMIGRDRFVGKVRFRAIDENLYDLYDREVKDPAIVKTKSRGRSISFRVFRKLQYAFDTLLYNLKNRDTKSISQIKSLMVDKFGNSIASAELIRDHISKIEALEKAPALTDEGIFEGKPVDVNEIEDISIDSIEKELGQQEKIGGEENQGKKDQQPGGTEDPQ